jgi:tetratricopeptide (TPR) repeat protein
MPAKVLYYFKSVYKPLLAMVCVVLFFASYNTYLVDHSLNNLKLALTQTASAETLENTKSLQAIVDYALISELTAYKMDSGTLAGLTLSRSIIAKGKSQTQIKDMESALKEIIQRREKQRGSVLTIIDTTVGKLNDIKDRLTAMLLPGKARTGKTADSALLEQARKMKESWKLPQAIEDYELFIASYPNYENIDGARLELAYCYEESKDYQKARSIYERIAKLSGGTKEARVAQAALVKIREIENLIYKKDRLAAQLTAQKTVPQLQETYYQLGTIYTKLLDFPQARESYKKVVELNADSELALKAKFNLGWVYKFQNKLEESSGLFKEIAETIPDSEMAANSKLQVADNLGLQERFAEALKVYREVADNEKNKILAKQAQLQVAYTYLYGLNDPAASKREFDKLVRPVRKEISQDIGKEYRLEGYALLNEKRYQEAAEKFNYAIKLNPADSSAYLGLSYLYRNMGDIAQALAMAKKASEVNENDEYAFATLGELYTESKKNYDAIVAYKRAVAIKNNYPEALYNLGYLYHITLQYDEAIATLEQAVSALPSYTEAYNNLGVAYWQKGRISDAIRTLELALKLKPDYLDALHNLGLVYESQGQYKEAKEAFLKILKIDPRDLLAQKELQGLEKR